MKLGSFVGCMTGTSVDALDLALIDVSHPNGPESSFNEEVTVAQAHTVPLPESLRDARLACGQPDRSSGDLLGRCDRLLGEFIGESITRWLHAIDVEPTSVTAIGSHGQTVRHRPPGSVDQPFTLQIGDPNCIAELTGIDTIADFRRRDMAADGQGAPLAPAFHRVLFGKLDGHLCILNIGGISNISPFGDHHGGFDVGPGNCLMDEWYAAHHTDDGAERYDASGAWAASGNVHDALLASLLKDPYLALNPPKSTGREYFNRAWLNPHLEQTAGEIAKQDVQATLAEFTAITIADGIRKSLPDVSHVPVCGGGRLNTHLLQRLVSALHARGHDHCVVKPTEHWGIDGDAVEAAAVAWLAYRRHYLLPGNMTEATGAKGPRVLGAIYPG